MKYPVSVTVEWIKVDDELPPDNHFVIGCDEDGERFVCYRVLSWWNYGNDIKMDKPPLYWTPVDGILGPKEQ